MGKQTTRQMAKRKAEASQAAPPQAASLETAFSETEWVELCCLPYCEADGDKKLPCKHRLCSLDLLTLAKIAGNLQRFVVTCPICRCEHLMHMDSFLEPVSKMPFKYAKFDCACTLKNCKRSSVFVVEACETHKSYSCKVCVGSGSVRMYTRDVTDFAPV